MSGATLPLHFYVEGDPAPQGSKNIGRYGQVYESSKRVGPWRDAIAWTAAAAMRRIRWKTETGPVAVIVVFDVTRNDDLDKLQRAVGDALQAAGVFADDKQIVEWHARKRRALVGSDRRPRSGADIIVQRRGT